MPEGADSVRTIESGGVRLATLITVADRQPGLSFFSDDNDYIQVGMWGYDAGKHLQAHIHNIVPREVDRTQEVVCVLAGRLKSTIYDEAEQRVDEVELAAGDVLILLAGGHSYDILEDGTQVLEVKNGPYPGAETDRRRFDGE